MPAKILSLILLVVVCLWLAGCSTPAPSFPIGIYAVPDTNDFPVLRQAGFNLVRGPARKEYLDAAHAAGLKVLPSPGTAAGDQFHARRARATVEALDSHPALWAWYLIDEPDLNLVSPEHVSQSHRFLKTIPARKPTSLVVFSLDGIEHFARIADITMIDRYPIPWLPLADFANHVRMTRIAAGPQKSVIAVIQAFDWSAHKHLLPQEDEAALRPPSYQEMRCMAYAALAAGANGIFFYSFADSRWKIREHPQVWEGLQRVVAEIRQREPLFQAQPLWWPIQQHYSDYHRRLSEVMDFAIMTTRLQAETGNDRIPAGEYLLLVNTTPHTHHFSIRLPHSPQNQFLLPVVGEDREVLILNEWISDEFSPYAVHIYGPLQPEAAEP